MPSGSRIPFPLAQGNAYVRDGRYALSADAQVPPAQVRASAGAQALPALAFNSASAVSASAQVHLVVAEAPAQPAVECDRPLVRFAVSPVAGSSAPGQVEEEDDDGASIMSNPPVVDKTLARLASFHPRFVSRISFAVRSSACSAVQLRIIICTVNLLSPIIRASTFILLLPLSPRALSRCPLSCVSDVVPIRCGSSEFYSSFGCLSGFFAVG